MPQYELIREGAVKSSCEARDIDAAVDTFFPNTRVDVDLDTARNDWMEVRPQHSRRSLAPFIIKEKKT